MKSTFNRKIAIITGASSGIGLRCANLLEKNGYKIYNLCKSNAESETIVNINLDISESEKVISAVNSIYKNEKRIDVLINCAAISIASPLEKTLSTDYRYLFDVNFFGTVETIKAVLPYMKQQRHGRIINISSLAAIVPIPFQAFYCSSKAALNMLTLELNTELKKYNIKVLSVMPGATKTPFTEKRKIYTLQQNEDYNEDVMRSAKIVANMEQTGMPPEKVAKKVYKQIIKKNPKPLASVGFKNNLNLIFQKILPSKLVLKFVNKNFDKDIKESNLKKETKPD